MTTFAAHAPNLPGSPVADEGVPRNTENPGPLPGRRRRFSAEEKRQFIAEAMSPGQSMSSVGRRHGLSVSLLFRWRRQLDGERRPTPAQDQDGARAELRVLRDRVRELERLLGRKTHELETLQQEMSRLGHNPALAPARQGFATTR
ncbi:MAG TPA: transposase [Polyangia bacterium]